MAARFRMPHTLTLLFVLMVLALVATWVIPQGQFQTEVTEAGQELVVAGTYEVAEERAFVSPWELFTAVPRAFAEAQNIIFFLFIVGGVVAIIRATGAIDALLGGLLKGASRWPSLLIFSVVFVFALTSSAMGASAEYIPFVLILVALCRALRMDTMVAVGMIVAGYGIGYGMASFNPYTVIPAQEIAGVPTYSGWLWKHILLFFLVLIGVHHVWSYARKVQADPSKSLVKDIDPPDQGAPPTEYPSMTARHVLILVGFIAALGISVWGISEWGWYLT
ncbi:MAG: YfcC family protein, partial [Gemmatimonadales bacterium]